MGRIENGFDSLKPVMLMIVAQAALAGVNIFYKLAADFGTSLRVLIAYRFLLATVFIVPIALIIERNKRPKLTWKVIGQGFLCGLLGALMTQNLYAESLVLTSATFAAAMTNIIPAITFTLAITFGLENLGWSKLSGKAKVVGTLVCIGGAMVLTFYKGAELNIWSTSVDLLHHNVGHVALQPSNPVLGAFLAVCCCFSSATSLIIQAKMLKEYPCPYSSTALMMIMGSIQAIVFALCMERSNWSRWKMGWDIRLLSVSYTGIVGSGVTFTLKAWCVQMRGPLFVSVFNPLMLVLVAIAGSLILNEKLHVGSVLGAGIIVCGLYMVLWGKGKELKKQSQLVPTQEVEKSGKIDIIVATSSEDNKLAMSTTSNASLQNGISVVSHGEYFDFEASEETIIDEKPEEKCQEGRGSKISVNAQI